MPTAPTVNEVMGQYSFLLDAVGDYEDRLAGNGLFGESRERLLERFAEIRNEVKQLFTLAVFAAAEAAIRLHFKNAATTGNPAPFAQMARDIAQAYGDKVPLEEIFDAWKKWPGAPAGFENAIGNLAQVMRRRDWLAHGRYWDDQSGLPNADPDHVNGILSEIKSLVTSFPCP